MDSQFVEVEPGAVQARKVKFDETYDQLIAEFSAARDLLEMLKRLPVAVGDSLLSYDNGVWRVRRGENETEYLSLNDAIISFTEKVYT